MLEYTKNSPPAVVIGLNINGLGTVRALGRSGVPVIAITGGSHGPSEHSRYCKKLGCPELYSSEDALIHTLVTLGQSLSKPAVLFPSGDLFLSAVSRRRAELSPYYLFPFAAPETVELILHKSAFYRFAIKNGFPIAKTFFPGPELDIKSIAQQVTYPCVLKPSQAGPEWRKRGWKIHAVTQAEELIRWYEICAPVEPDLVVQEVTPGPDSALSFSLAYCIQPGEMAAVFTGRKLRQYIPRFGISSLAESLWSEEVSERSAAVFKALQYTGYGSIEFKRNSSNGEFEMTEVTGRTWYPHALSERCGVNLPLLAYRHLNGFPLGPASGIGGRGSYRDGVKWIDEYGDTLSALEYIRNGELSLRGWLRSYRGKRFYALCALDDPAPGFALFFFSLKQIVKAALRPIRNLLLGAT